MKRKGKACAAVLLAVLLLCLPVNAAFAVSEEALAEKYSDTAAHLRSLPPAVGSIGGEWVILGLARGDLLDDAARQTYYDAVCQYVTAVGSDKLHKRKSSDNSRVIIALSAIGRRADDVAGHDLTAPLGDYDYVTRQGVNGAIWALLALDSCGYPIKIDPDVTNPATREKLMEAILSAQCSDGGWALDGDVSDPDMTAMALQALAPYRFYSMDIAEAADRGVARLAALQHTGGGYDSYQEFNPESCAQVIVALTTLSIDTQTDERFLRGERTLLDNLMSFSVPNGFSHSLGGSYNQMATEQVFYALTAYYRFGQQKTSLYDMTDVLSAALYDYDGDGRETINDATYLQRYLAEYEDAPLTVSQMRFADLNRNGLVDITDVTLLCIHLLYQ